MTERWLQETPEGKSQRSSEDQEQEPRNRKVTDRME
jgi:hypothetical protein